MLTEDQKQKLLADFEAARLAENKIGDSKASAALARAYGRAYQRLVSAGLAPQIRKKYRPAN